MGRPGTSSSRWCPTRDGVRAFVASRLDPLRTRARCGARDDGIVGAPVPGYTRRRASHGAGARPWGAPRRHVRDRWIGGLCLERAGLCAGRVGSGANPTAGRYHGEGTVGLCGDPLGQASTAGASPSRRGEPRATNGATGSRPCVRPRTGGLCYGVSHADPPAVRCVTPRTVGRPVTVEGERGQDRVPVRAWNIRTESAPPLRGRHGP